MTFTVPAAAGPSEPDGINWDAYTHEELYRMVWDEADVGEVGAIAEEWRRHSAELAEQATRLREQQAALGDDWQGESADLAATRLGELAERIDGISARAADNQRAAQQAGEALALVRATLPPPPGAPPLPSAPPPPAPTATQSGSSLPFAPQPFALPTLSSASQPFALPTLQSAPQPFTLPSAPAPLALPSAPQPYSPPSTGGFFLVFGAPPTTTTSGTGMAPAFGSVATSGSSMYFGDIAANQAKAQAVQAMRVYESSLRGGESLVAVADGVGGRTYGVAGSGPAPTPRGSGAHGGVPWSTLAHPTGEPRHGGGAQLGTGPRLTAAQPAPTAGPLPAAAEAAASSGRATGTAGGMAPSAGQRGGSDEDETHENRMPVLDHGLFTVDVRTSAAVIGGDL